LMRFRALAWRQCFLEIARPSRGVISALRRHSTVKNPSRLRAAFANTRPNAAASSSRLFFLNRWLPLLVNTEWLLFVVADAGCVTASTARDLSRGGASTRDALPWWPCAHENRGCGHVLFCWAEMCVSWLITWVISRPKSGRTFKRAASVYRRPDSVNRAV